MAENKQQYSILICGWKQNTPDFVDSLTANSSDAHVTIVSRLPEDICNISALQPNVSYICGDQTCENTLAAAGIARTALVFVLADESNHGFSRNTVDSLSVKTAEIVKKMAPEAAICVEVFSEKLIPVLRILKVNEIICIDRITRLLSSQTLSTPSLPELIDRFIDDQSPTRIMAETVTDTMTGKTYEETCKYIRAEHNGTAFAIFQYVRSDHPSVPPLTMPSGIINITQFVKTLRDRRCTPPGVLISPPLDHIMCEGTVVYYVKGTPSPQAAAEPDIAVIDETNYRLII